MSLHDSFRVARIVRLVNLLLQAVLFLALFGGLNYIALNHSWRFDLTRNRQQSLSPETRSYLEQLDRDVRIVVTLTNDGENADVNQAYRDISALLREYVYLTRRNSPGKIEVEYVNIYQNRKRAEELELERANEVIVMTDKGHRRTLTLSDFYNVKSRTRRESFKGESAVTSAVLDVSQPDKRKIYFLAGHGEMRPDDVERTRGLSGLSDELRQRNFEIASLDLSLTRKIPDDADKGLLIIAGPKGPYQRFEELLLQNFLTTRAGRVIILLEPGQPQTGLENLLFDWGIIAYDNFVIDPDPNSITENGDFRLWRFLRDPASHITDSVIDNNLPVLVGPARVVSNDLGAVDDGLSVKKLIASSDKAWGETSYRLRPPFQYTPGQDLHGELGIMVVSERLKPANLPLSVRGGRLAVFGAADVVTNNRIFNLGNLDLFLATVRWAVADDTPINVPARPIQRFALSLSQEELNRLRLGLVFGVPAAVALLGLIVYWTRRN
jgi:hypothetical protein